MILCILLQMKTWAVSPKLFPCDLSAEGKQLAEDAVSSAVAAWGERQVRNLSLCNIVTTFMYHTFVFSLSCILTAIITPLI